MLVAEVGDLVVVVGVVVDGEAVDVEGGVLVIAGLDFLSPTFLGGVAGGAAVGLSLVPKEAGGF